MKKKEKSYEIGNLAAQKLKPFLCKKSNTGWHESGEWEVEEEESYYKVLVKKCKYCNKKMNEQVIK